MDGVQFDADETAIEIPRRDKGRARTAEWIEDRIARLRESLDQRPENADGFLRRMQPVPAIGPADYVGRRAGGRRGPPLGEQVSLLVLIAQVARGRRVFFG